MSGPTPAAQSPLSIDPWYDVKLIGVFIMNFSMAEFATLSWIAVLKPSVDQRNFLDSTFSQRVDQIIGCLKSNSMGWPLPRRDRALDIWKELKQMAWLRNRIAHNPLCQINGAMLPDKLRLINFRKMPAVDSMYFEEVDYRWLHAQADAVKALAFELLAWPETVVGRSTPDTKAQTKSIQPWPPP